MSLSRLRAWSSCPGKVLLITRLGPNICSPGYISGSDTDHAMASPGSGDHGGQGGWGGTALEAEASSSAASAEGADGSKSLRAGVPVCLVWCHLLSGQAPLSAPRRLLLTGSAQCPAAGSSLLPTQHVSMGSLLQGLGLHRPLCLSGSQLLSDRFPSSRGAGAPP